MIKRFIVFFGLFLFVLSCKKNNEPDGPFLPVGTEAYTESEIAFVPYSAGDLVFKKSPDFTEERILNFKERLATEEFFAWDQTYFTFSYNPLMEIEFRLRYLQTENVSQKTLAIYMPYRDVTSAYRTNVFEMPIDTTGMSTGFFSEIITYHDTITINGNDWYNVYEVNPLTSTNESLDSPTNYSKVFFNSTFGIIEMDQKDGSIWVLFP